MLYYGNNMVLTKIHWGLHNKLISLSHSPQSNQAQSKGREMRVNNTYSVCMLEEVANHIRGWSELINFLRHGVERDDGVVFMLASWFAAKGQTATSRAIPAMLHHQTSNKESLRVDREVLQWCLIEVFRGVVAVGGDGDGALTGVFLVWGGERGGFEEIWGFSCSLAEEVGKSGECEGAPQDTWLVKSQSTGVVSGSQFGVGSTRRGI